MSSTTTETTPRTDWYKVSNVDDVASPALLVYPDRVEENIRRMIQIAGGVDRLRPHMKTNKLPEVIRMQMAQGIMKYKCATIAEAEVAAACAVPDVLLAYQPVGPNVQRLVQLVKKFPATRFSALVDDAGAIEALSRAASAAGVTLDLFVDLDCGMHRTGIAPGPDAVRCIGCLRVRPDCAPRACTSTTGTFAIVISRDALLHATPHLLSSNRCASSSWTPAWRFR
jgi:D-serine deaminase-like pyridoxal phosphate-dependent protein